MLNLPKLNNDIVQNNSNMRSNIHLSHNYKFFKLNPIGVDLNSAEMSVEHNNTFEKITSNQTL